MSRDHDETNDRPAYLVGWGIVVVVIVLYGLMVVEALIAGLTSP